ncbi:filament integrity protein FraC [Egbenema bharatensis]|uniref:filament integrity protein FraC n=1 Tax=Egbenema bharatensis TaxID=3463334 RepID=UPI003A8B62CD
MFPTVLPLRAIAFQALFLLIAIAIEATVLRRTLATEKKEFISPKQSIHYAGTINLLCTVVGWLGFFLFFTIAYTLPSAWTARVEANLVNFIFFDQWTNETATSLIVIGLIMFFASYGVKQAGLNGLRSTLQAGIDNKEKEQADPGESGESVIQEVKSPRRWARSGAIRVRGKETSALQTMPPQAKAVFYANAWSFSAILAILMLRLALLRITV